MTGAGSGSSSGINGAEVEAAGDDDEAAGAVSRGELRRTLEVFRGTLARLGPVSLRAATHHVYVVEDRHSEVRPVVLSSASRLKICLLSSVFVPLFLFSVSVSVNLFQSYFF